MKITWIANWLKNVSLPNHSKTSNLCKRHGQFFFELKNNSETIEIRCFEHEDQVTIFERKNNGQFEKIYESDNVLDITESLEKRLKIPPFKS